MFAALCQMPDFYKLHMVRFIAIAPVVRCNNMGSKLIQEHKNDEKFWKTFDNAFGPEVMTEAS